MARNQFGLEFDKKFIALLKNKISEKHSSILEALQKAMKEAWMKEIFPNCCRELVDSMPRRLQEVIRTKTVTQNINCKLF